MSAKFRKTRRYMKVVCCVLNLCTRFCHQTVHVDQTVHSMCTRFRKKRCYTKVVCCVLMILPTPVLALQLCENALKMNCQCCERQISARRGAIRKSFLACRTCALGSVIKPSMLIKPSILCSPRSARRGAIQNSFVPC